MVYRHLYHLLSACEDSSLFQLPPGAILREEGVGAVEKRGVWYVYDLACNPHRFSSWWGLAKLYYEVNRLGTASTCRPHRMRTHPLIYKKAEEVRMLP